MEKTPGLIISVQPMWSELDNFYYAVTVKGEHEKGFMILVRGCSRTSQNFWGATRSAVETWCRLNVNELPAAGATKEFEWERLAKETDSPK